MNKYCRLLRYDGPLHFTLLLTNWLPDNTGFMKLRGKLSSFFLKSCGRGLIMGRNVVFYNPSQISLGSDVYIAYNCWFSGGNKIIIGNKVLFGPGCIIASGRHLFANNNFFDESTVENEEIIIGDGCWMAGNVNIAGGTTLGKGCLVASGTSLKGEYPDFVMIASSKAEIKKHLK